MKNLIVEVKSLIYSSKGVLERLKSRDLAERVSGLEMCATSAPKAVELMSDRGRLEERRRANELSPDILELVASCGERVRETDKWRLEILGRAGAAGGRAPTRRLNSVMPEPHDRVHESAWAPRTLNDCYSHPTCAG